MLRCENKFPGVCRAGPLRLSLLFFMLFFWMDDVLVGVYLLPGEDDDTLLSALYHIFVLCMLGGKIMV